MQQNTSYNPVIWRFLKQRRKFENFETWKYVIGAITDVLLFVSDCRKQPFRAGLEKVFLKFMQNAWKIHVKEFVFFVKLQARNLKGNLIMDSFWSISHSYFLDFKLFFMSFESQERHFSVFCIRRYESCY